MVNFFAEKKGMDYFEISARNNRAEECEECVRTVIDSWVSGRGKKNEEDEVITLKKIQFKYGVNCF